MLQTETGLAKATRVGHTRSHAWGESHLWVRDCKASNLSGFVEPRILAPSGRGVSSDRLKIAKLSDFSEFEYHSTKELIHPWGRH